jgi:hypothetical protein
MENTDRGLVMTKAFLFLILISFALLFGSCRSGAVGSSNDVEPDVDPDIIFEEGTVRNKKAIQSVKAHIVRDGNTKVKLEDWIKKRFPESSKILWEVNDCGEQSGSPDQTDFPLCAEASTEVGGKTYSVSYSVGSYKEGLAGGPQFWWFQYANGDYYEIGNSLEEWNKIIEAVDKKAEEVSKQQPTNRK